MALFLFGDIHEGVFLSYKDLLFNVRYRRIEII